MSIKNILLLLLLTISILVTACNNQKNMGQQEALELAWKTLDPNTVAHNREDWEIHEARKVLGKDVVGEFSALRNINCPGPMLPENQPIKISSEYWYIRVLPHPQVYRPLAGTDAPELAPVVPEPNISEAAFLIDQYRGVVIARRLLCRAR